MHHDIFTDVFKVFYKLECLALAGVMQLCR